MLSVSRNQAAPSQVRRSAAQRAPATAAGPHSDGAFHGEQRSEERPEDDDREQAKRDVGERGDSEIGGEGSASRLTNAADRDDTTVPTLRGVTLGNAAVVGAIGLSAKVLVQSHGSAVGAIAPSTIHRRVDGRGDVRSWPSSSRSKAWGLPASPPTVRPCAGMNGDRISCEGRVRCDIPTATSPSRRCGRVSGCLRSQRRDGRRGRSVLEPLCRLVRAVRRATRRSGSSRITAPLAAFDGPRCLTAGAREVIDAAPSRGKRVGRVDGFPEAARTADRQGDMRKVPGARAMPRRGDRQPRRHLGRSRVAGAASTTRSSGSPGVAAPARQLPKAHCRNAGDARRASPTGSPRSSRHAIDGLQRLARSDRDDAAGTPITPRAVVVVAVGRCVRQAVSVRAGCHVVVS